MSRYNRDRSPEYAAGGSGIPPRVPSPAFVPPAAADQHARLEYAPQAPQYFPPPPNAGNLQIPDDSRARPRSLPPPAEYRRSRSRQDRHRERDRDRDRDRGRYDDDDRGRDDDGQRDRTPVGKAKQFVDNNFSDSTTGLGVGVLGALVGGLAAHEAVDATGRGHHGSQRRNQLLSTVVGAAVGALGANAFEKRLENGRDKTRDKQDRWEQKWGKAPGGSRGDVSERREVATRPRSGGGRKDWDYDNRRPGSSRSAREREVDPDARSWKNVEDWVYDDRDGDRRRKSGDGYRY